MLLSVPLLLPLCSKSWAIFSKHQLSKHSSQSTKIDGNTWCDTRYYLCEALIPTLDTLSKFFVIRINKYCILFLPVAGDVEHLCRNIHRKSKRKIVFRLFDGSYSVQHQAPVFKVSDNTLTECERIRNTRMKFRADIYIHRIHTWSYGGNLIQKELNYSFLLLIKHHNLNKNNWEVWTGSFQIAETSR